MSVPGDNWPIFIYRNYHFDEDDPWNGAFQSEILISVLYSQAIYERRPSDLTC